MKWVRDDRQKITKPTINGSGVMMEDDGAGGEKQEGAEGNGVEEG
jgi:hypothetical protein